MLIITPLVHGSHKCKHAGADFTLCVICNGKAIILRQSICAPVPQWRCGGLLLAARDTCMRASPPRLLSYHSMRNRKKLLRSCSSQLCGNRPRAGQIPELQSFVQSIERDKAAMLAGLTLPHNNGVGDRQGEQIKARSRA